MISREKSVLFTQKKLMKTDRFSFNRGYRVSITVKTPRMFSQDILIFSINFNAIFLFFFTNRKRSPATHPRSNQQSSRIRLEKSPHNIATNG